MTRVLKLAGATIGAAVAVATAFFLHPRSGARRRAVAGAAIRRESANVAALIGSALEPQPSPRFGRRSGDHIAERARLALSASFGEPAEAITVRAHDGVVTLRGEVDDMADISRYEAAIRTIPGVRDVDNLLRLRLPGFGRPRVLTA